MNLKDLDIVYFVKESYINEELRYSLRSVSQNFPYRQIWFFGGCPRSLHPDNWVHVNQNQKTKWDNTSKLLRSACENSEVSENFVLFNDDFFIMKPVVALPYFTHGTLQHRVESLTTKLDKVSSYCSRLNSTIQMLEARGLPTLNYAVHYPIIINKEEMLETFEAFPEGLMWRSIYGNHHTKPSIDVDDCKISDKKTRPSEDCTFLSTQDDTFRLGAVGKHIRTVFNTYCKFETYT